MSGAAILEHRHIARCSDTLRRDTAAVEAWGRQRWPDARVMHELQVGGCRLDMAFVQPAHLIGVEIKSERDTLARLATQTRHYMAEIPEVWVAHSPKWTDTLSRGSEEAKIPYSVGRVIVGEEGVQETIQRNRYVLSQPAHPSLMLTAPMLHLLWRSEIGALARKHGISLSTRLTLPKALPILARKLTGDQIVEGVCGLLRARKKTGGYAADPAISSEAETSDPADQTKGGL